MGEYVLLLLNGEFDVKDHSSDGNSEVYAFDTFALAQFTKYLFGLRLSVYRRPYEVQSLAFGEVYPSEVVRHCNLFVDALHVFSRFKQLFV